MPKIAFVDHHLNNYHADVFLSIFRKDLADEQIEVVAAFETDPVGDDWCAGNDVRRAESIQDALEGVDGVIVLAPDNIDAHLALCRVVLPKGLPTVIDKFLAPRISAAEEIVQLACQHGAPIFSASGLRFSVELEKALAGSSGPAPEAFVRGFGDWGIYGVHTVGMAARIMGPGLKRVLDTGTSTSHVITLDYGDDRRAFVELTECENQMDAFPWQFAVRQGNKLVSDTVADFHGFYVNLLRHAAHMFKTGHSTIPVEEMLDVVRILERASVSRAIATWA